LCRYAEVWAAVERARGVGANSVLNVAPAAPVPEHVLRSLDFLIVNEHEALEVFVGCGLGAGGGGGALAGDGGVDALDASITICTNYNVAVVVTLGAEGAAACLPRRPPGCDVRRTDGECDVLTVDAAPLLDG
jgi:ribokinase